MTLSLLFSLPRLASGAILLIVMVAIADHFFSLSAVIDRSLCFVCLYRRRLRSLLMFVDGDVTDRLGFLFFGQFHGGMTSTATIMIFLGYCGWSHIIGCWYRPCLFAYRLVRPDSVPATELNLGTFVSHSNPELLYLTSDCFAPSTALPR